MNIAECSRVNPWAIFHSFSQPMSADLMLQVVIWGGDRTTYLQFGWPASVFPSEQKRNDKYVDFSNPTVLS